MRKQIDHCFDACFDHMSRHVTDALKQNELSFDSDKWRLVFAFRSYFHCVLSYVMFEVL